MKKILLIVFLLISLIVIWLILDRNSGTLIKERTEQVLDYNKVKERAEQGLDLAQYFLGLMYQEGEGITQDYSKAVTWYRKAAEQGHARAQYSLGQMYDQGLGVTQNYKEAFKWYRKAAEKMEDLEELETLENLMKNLK